MAPHNRLTAIRWYNSLIFRTGLLCAVLLLCLLGSVYALSIHYLSQVASEMEEQTNRLADDLVRHLTEHPSDELGSVADALKSDLTEVQLEQLVQNEEGVQVSVHLEDGGRMRTVTRKAVQVAGRAILLTTYTVLSPQTEILRAFSNRYFLGLAAVFLLAIGFIVYYIGKTLKPLRELSDRCARVSSGDLRPVCVGRNSDEILTLEQTFNTMIESLKEKEIVEAKLRQAQRLSAMGNLAAGIAHDLRNPLNAIKLLASHAMDSVESEKAERPLQTICSEVDRLEEIVSGFLSLAKERAIEPSPCRMDVLLKDCVRLVSKEAESRGVRVTADLGSGDTLFMLDAKQWTRAVLNVLINAIEACDPGGEVRLMSRLYGGRCVVTVEDEGPGMTQEALEHAFDPYFTTKPTGTGLGLSITRGLVEEHGGTIEISKRDTGRRGCLVRIELPVPGVREEAMEPPRPVMDGERLEEER